MPDFLGHSHLKVNIAYFMNKHSAKFSSFSEVMSSSAQPILFEPP